MQVNLNTVFTLCRDVGAHMLGLEPHPVTERKGSVINFASLLTFQGGMTVPAYAASKGAVGQLTKSFANEWTKEGITVNAIAPGYIETEMNEALLKDEGRLRSISERIPAGRVSSFLSFILSFLNWTAVWTVSGSMLANVMPSFRRRCCSGEVRKISRGRLCIWPVKRVVT